MTDTKKDWQEEFDKQFVDFQEGVTIIKNPIASDDIKLFISQIEQRAEERGYVEGKRFKLMLAESDEHEAIKEAESKTKAKIIRIIDKYGQQIHGGGNARRLWKQMEDAIKLVDEKN